MIAIEKHRTDWEYKRLQFGASILNSNVDKKIVEGEIAVKLCNYVDVYYNDIISESLGFMDGSATEDEIDKFKVREGDIIITKDSESADDIGIPAYVEKDLENVVCGYHLAMFKPFRDQLNGKFLLYFLNSKIAQKNFELGANGVTRFGLGRNAIKTLQVPYPKPSEQTLIARFLDQKTSQLDALIEQKEQLLKLLAEKRTAIITQAVTKGLPAEERSKAGLDPDVEMKDSGIDWLGEIPKEWEVKRIDFLATVKARLGWKGLKAEEYVDEGYIFLSTPNIKSNSEIDFDNVNYITEARYVESPEIMLREGDVLLAKDGSTLGITNIVKNLPAPATVNSSIAVIRIRDQEEILPEFLFRWITAGYIQNKITMMKDGQGVPHLFQADIKKFKVLVPSLDEQKRICEYLRKTIAAIDLCLNKIENSIQNQKEYREALITSAVTGQIDVRKEVTDV